MILELTSKQVIRRENHHAQEGGGPFNVLENMDFCLCGNDDIGRIYD